MNKVIDKNKLVTLIILLVVGITLLTLGIIFFDPIIEGIKENFVSNNNFIEVLKGLLNTIIITIVSFIIGIIVGMIICLIQGLEGDHPLILVLKNIAKFYVSIFRGTPLMVQLLIIYFVIFASFRGDSIYIAIIAFGLNSGAYVSEILRGGILSLPKGQMEAGRSLGLTYPTTMRKIILPQAIRNALPSLGNEFISLIKETSIVGFIGAFDLTLAFRKIANDTFDFEMVYIVMGIVYFVIIYIITVLLNKLERRLLKNVKTK
ncbi:MAG: amino acid ABC transporter permease [Erysipelotrichaceae bacterium]|nr:amino acid ABC transporter permease [Erysipelotrichaceae bacterium]